MNSTSAGRGHECLYPYFWDDTIFWVFSPHKRLVKVFSFTKDTKKHELFHVVARRALSPNTPALAGGAISSLRFFLFQQRFPRSQQDDSFTLPFVKFADNNLLPAHAGGPGYMTIAHWHQRRLLSPYNNKKPRFENEKQKSLCLC